MQSLMYESMISIVLDLMSKAGVHQGSVLSTISCHLRIACPWELLNADDLLIIAETKRELLEMFCEWKINFERKGDCRCW